jgi:Tfp pilus assembly protein PilO
MPSLIHSTERYKELLPAFKEKRNQQFTTLILTLFALILFGIFAINPTLSTIFQLRKQLEDNQAVDKKLDEKIANLSLLQQQYVLLSNDIPLVFRAVPETPDLTIFIGQLQALAKSNNVSKLSIQTSPVSLTPGKKAIVSSSDGKIYSQINFTLTTSGSYDSILSFFRNLVSFDRIVTLDTLSIGHASQSDSISQIVISGRAYYK